MEKFPSWVEHFDVVQWLLVALLGMIAWFAIQSFNGILHQLNRHDIDIKDLRKDHVELRTEVSELKGAHEATHPIYNSYR